MWQLLGGVLETEGAVSRGLQESHTDPDASGAPWVLRASSPATRPADPAPLPPFTVPGARKAAAWVPGSPAARPAEPRRGRHSQRQEVWALGEGGAGRGVEGTGARLPASWSAWGLKSAVCGGGAEGSVFGTGASKPRCRLKLDRKLPSGPADWTRTSRGNVIPVTCRVRL